MFSKKRLDAVKKGRVLYCIFADDECIFRHSNFFTAMQTLTIMQKDHPETCYSVKVEEMTM